MAKRPTGNTATASITDAFFNNTAPAHAIEAIDQSNTTEEQGVLTGILNGQYNAKNTGLNKLSGARTVVTYFRQVPLSENNALVNISGFSSADPNLQRFVRVDNFSVKMDIINVNADQTESNGTKAITLEGKITVFPNTLLPCPNDRFVTKYMDKVREFKITDVTPLSGDSVSTYECQFICEDDTFDYEYLGTDLRTVYRKSEYAFLNFIKGFYIELGKTFKELFWDDEIGTYLIDRISEEEMSFEDPIYDPLLIEFLLNNRIYENLSYYPVIPMQFGYNLRAKYKTSIFNVLEKGTTILFSGNKQRVVRVGSTAYNETPILYGKYVVTYGSAFSNGELISDSLVSDCSDAKTTIDSTTSLYEDMINIIQLYINKDFKNVEQQVKYLENKYDEIDSFYSLVSHYKVFYTLPMFGFVLKKLAEYIVSSVDTIASLSNPILTRTVNKN